MIQEITFENVILKMICSSPQRKQRSCAKELILYLGLSLVSDYFNSLWLI